MRRLFNWRRSEDSASTERWPSADSREEETPEGGQDVAECPDCGETLLECRCGGPDGELVALVRPTKWWDIEHFCGVFREPPGRLLAMIEPDDTFGLIAETARGTPVAAAVLTRRRHGFTLRRFAVLPEWRHRGIGRRLMQDIRSRLKVDRSDWLVSVLPETAVDLQCFLREEGFLLETICRPKPDDVDQRDLYVFRWEAETPHGAKFVPTHRLRHLLATD